MPQRTTTQLELSRLTDLRTLCRQARQLANENNLAEARDCMRNARARLDSFELYSLQAENTVAASNSYVEGGDFW